MKCVCLLLVLQLVYFGLGQGEEDPGSTLAAPAPCHPSSSSDSSCQGGTEHASLPGAFEKDATSQDQAVNLDELLEGPFLHRSSTDLEEDVSEEDDDDEDEDDEEEEVERVYKIWDRTEFTLDDFAVNGINLAKYGQQPLFQLYEDFDISSMIEGDEEWEELLSYRNGLTRPSLSFYVDKVARKRWLPVMGFPQPEVHFLKYAEELTETGDIAEETAVIRAALPERGSYCAKPTHMSLTKGTWLVDHREDEPTRFSLHGYELADHDGEFNVNIVAEQLAEMLHDEADEIESWTLKNVKPGLVVEERWCSHTDPNSPPHEFNMFVIWGRVWVGQWNTVHQENRYCDGFIYRNGTIASGGFHPVDYTLPDWLPWDELVEIAERLGAHKDMFRVDIFVGRPSSAGPSSPLQIGVSESEIFPTTIFGHDELSREGARLWIAGYMLGMYEQVPNKEIPLEYLQQGLLSDKSKGAAPSLVS